LHFVRHPRRLRTGADTAYGSTMTVLLIALNVLAFVLPAVGFWLLFARVHASLRGAERTAKERGSEVATIGDFNRMMNLVGAQREQAKWLKWDILWVIVGLACGAAANLIPLLAAA
jgi:hypothetical protein